MTIRRIKIGILAASVGIGTWVIYEVIVIGISPQRIILLLYVALVIGAVLLMRGPALVPAKTVEPEEIVKKVKTGPEEVILSIIGQTGKAKRTDLLPRVGMSKSSLVRLLDGMEKRGLITQIGEKKGTHYTLKGPGP